MRCLCCNGWDTLGPPELPSPAKAARRGGPPRLDAGKGTRRTPSDQCSALSRIPSPITSPVTPMPPTLLATRLCNSRTLNERLRATTSRKCEREEVGHTSDIPPARFSCFYSVRLNGRRTATMVTPVVKGEGWRCNEPHQSRIRLGREAATRSADAPPPLAPRTGGQGRRSPAQLIRAASGGNGERDNPPKLQRLRSDRNGLPKSACVPRHGMGSRIELTSFLTRLTSQHSIPLVF